MASCTCHRTPPPHTVVTPSGGGELPGFYKEIPTGIEKKYISLDPTAAVNRNSSQMLKWKFKVKPHPFKGPIETAEISKLQISNLPPMQQCAVN